tara:strand:+ start:111 stop:317 length:207 start_codon:yes stop_codon:yes gene_type:complete
MKNKTEEQTEFAKYLAEGFIAEVRRSRNNRLKQWKDDHIVIMGLDDKPEVKKQLDALINDELGITEDK